MLFRSVLYTMMKDALLFKNGVAKIFWDRTIEVTKETYESLTELERNAVLQDPDVEPIAYSSYQIQTPQGPMVACDLQVRRTTTKGRVKVVVVPPEEFLLTQRADSIQGARFCAHRCKKTVSDLIALGVPKERAESLASASSDGEYSLERQQRFSYDGDTSPVSDTTDKATRYVWLYECYALMDVDKDGIAERWKFLLAGDQYELISKEE